MFEGLRGHYGQPVFYAFASPQDDEVGLRWYMERTEAACGQITYANLWVNKFYRQTKPLLLQLIATQGHRIVLSANHEGISKFGPCLEAGSGKPGSLLGCVALPDDAVHTWQDDAKREATLESYLHWVRSVPAGTLFITCGGPLSKPLINAAWKLRPLNQYVDFGSSMDEILKGRTTRPYMRPDTPYYNQVVREAPLSLSLSLLLAGSATLLCAPLCPSASQPQALLTHTHTPAHLLLLSPSLSAGPCMVLRQRGEE
jgi:hypothetical protein